jgi:pimeloyl-ACP methyl ester carboxylesterase
MPTPPPKSGYFPCRLPYNRLGHGPRPLLVFQGLLFENKPQPAITLSWYRCLERDYTVYVVLRRPGLPHGYTLKDMADDYACLIQEEFEPPVDVLGVSTGGSIVHHFAADHPDLLRRLVIHSSAYTLSPCAKLLQLDLARLAGQRRWVEANALLVAAMLPHRGLLGTFHRPLTWIAARLMGWLARSADPNDLVVTVEAEDLFNFKDRLPEIKAPTLVAAGMDDPFYTPELFRDTAAGIPNARLALYPGVGHPASGKQFERDLLAFLREAA